MIMSNKTDLIKSRRILNGNRPKIDYEKGVKSGITPSTQFAELCVPENEALLLLKTILYTITLNSAVPLMFKRFLDLQLSAGLRVSELLSPPTFKINYLGQIYVYGSKGSNNKLVTPLFYRSYWSMLAPSVRNPYYGLSRFVMYRLYNKYELSYLHNNNVNKSVTHSIRHLHVMLMELMELPETEIARILGHKSLTAIKYYLSNGK